MQSNQNTIQPIDLEYFRSIRQEITDRIKIHYTMLGSKFLVVGGVFGFLAKDTQEKLISPFWAAALFSFIFDVILVDNLGWIKGAGHFVKEHFEAKRGYTSVPWEHQFAQPGNKSWCFDMWTYFFGIWSIGLAMWLAALLPMISREVVLKVSINTVLGIATTLLMFYSASLIIKSLGQKPSRDLSNEIPRMAADNEAERRLQPKMNRMARNRFRIYL